MNPVVWAAALRTMAVRKVNLVQLTALALENNLKAEPAKVTTNIH